MKKLMLIIACAAMTGLGLQSCNSTDRQVQNNVEKVVKNNYETVYASVNDKVVTLTGTVESQQEKTAVENSVRNVNNVKSVVNNISVRASEPMYMNNNMNSSNMNNNNTWHYYSDTEIRDQIMTRLNSQGYKNVRVDVSNGEVTLSGDLNRSDLSKVMQVANESDAIKITNNLNLK